MHNEPNLNGNKLKHFRKNNKKKFENKYIQNIKIKEKEFIEC